MAHLSCLSCICRATRVSLSASPVSFSASSCLCSCVDVLPRVIGFPGRDRYAMDWLPWLQLLCLFSAVTYHIWSCCSFQNRPPAVQGSPHNGQPPPCMNPALMNAPWVREGCRFIYFFMLYGIIRVSLHLLSVMAMLTGDTPPPKLMHYNLFPSMCPLAPSALLSNVWTQFQYILDQFCCCKNYVLIGNMLLLGSYLWSLRPVVFYLDVFKANQMAKFIRKIVFVSMKNGLLHTCYLITWFVLIFSSRAGLYMYIT